MVRPLDREIPHLVLPFEIRIEELEEERLSDYLRFRAGQNPQVIRRRLAGGDKCYLVMTEGQIVHCGWVARRRKYDPYLRCTIAIKPEDIFLYDHYTHPSWRGMGLSRAREVHVCNRYRKEGCQHSVAIVAVENKPGFHPFEAVGYHRTGTILSFWWLFGKRIWQQ